MARLLIGVPGPYLLLLLRLPHRTVMLLLVEHLLHLAVLQVVQLPHSILRPLDQVHQDPWRSITTYKIMLKDRTEQNRTGAT